MKEAVLTAGGEILYVAVEDTLSLDEVGFVVYSKYIKRISHFAWQNDNIKKPK